MLLTIITIGLLIIGFVITFCSIYCKSENGQVFGTILSAFSLLCLLCEGAIILKMKLPMNEERRRIAYEERREAIVASLDLDHWYPSTEAYKEIYQYNTEIKTERYYYSNSWFSWFASKAIAEQPTIELPKYKNI